MFMTGCKSCHDKDTDRLCCIGLCQVVITKTSQTMTLMQMTLVNDTFNDSCQKQIFRTYVMS